MRPHTRRRARGFTLVELMVSLAAGLFLLVSVAGVAKVATHTFHEETRVQVAELSLRVAAERLRADLARAGFMASSNVRVDPLLALAAGETFFRPDARFTEGLGRLAGVRYLPDALLAADDPNGQIARLSANNLGTTPDRLILGGNFTTADEYVVQSAMVDGLGCGGTTLTLSQDSPASARLLRGADGNLLGDEIAQLALRRAFAPISVSEGTPPQFMARVVDDTGKRQFVALCTDPVLVQSGIARVFLSPATPLLNAQDTGAQGGLTGFGVGRLTVNPVQLVEWSLRDRSAQQAGEPNWARDRGIDAQTKFDLMREFLDATGARAGNPELVAEYVVDFEIAPVVESPNAGTVPRVQAAAFDTPGDPAVLLANADSLNNQVGPQWIRGLRYRLATRAPLADRTTALPRPAGVGYAYRYCVEINGCAADNGRFARLRTLTGEVALPNQTRFP